MCGLLALGALAAAVIAYLSTQRAHRAEQQAVQARAGAEHLLGYLTDDFVRELESFGRLDVVAEFARRQIDYFHSLPESLKGPDTIRNGALAMVHYARAKRVLGDPGAASTTATEAVRLLEQRRRAGDDSEADTVALALAYVAQAQILEFQNDPNALVNSERASALLRPYVQARDPSVLARRAYVEVLVRLGFEQLRSTRYQDSANSLEYSAKLASDLGARDLSDLSMAAYYAEANAWRVDALVSLGRIDEAKRVAEDAVAVAEKVLAQRPGYRLALHAQQLLVGQLAGASMYDLDPLAAVANAKRAVQISLTLLDFDPGNIVTTNNLAVARAGMGDVYWTAGRMHEAMPYYDQSVKDAMQVTSGGPNLYVTSFFSMAYCAVRHAQIGDFSGAGAVLDSGKPYLDRLRQSTPKGSTALTIVDLENRLAVAAVAQQRDDDAAARRIAGDAQRELQDLAVKGGVEEFQKNTLLFLTGIIAGQSAMAQKDYAAAEQSLRTGLAARRAQGTASMDDQRTGAILSSWLAMALARQGKSPEAATLIAPAVKYERGLAARNHGDVWVPVELAGALYAQALTAPAQKPALLHEAAALLDALPADMRNMHDIRVVREYIGTERNVSH